VGRMGFLCRLLAHLANPCRLINVIVPLACVSSLLAGPHRMAPYCLERRMVNGPRGRGSVELILKKNIENPPMIWRGSFPQA